MKNVEKFQEYGKNLEFANSNDDVDSVDCHGNVYTNVNVDTDICNVINLQDVNHQSTNKVLDTNVCNVINLQDVNHQGTNTAGYVISFIQGELDDAQDGSQPNSGGGCVFNSIDNNLVYLVGEEQDSSLCNSNCVPVNIVTKTFL